ncbi:hypothetical protein JKA74_02910 [Marivirga sp. S37H4]|uniref:Uncharacterized protein n=1 Tax=Marivirga aurantiaca TaxID=2802615 RepID=A0A934WVZ4_9BACT|nr:hypothetical protein [Marivirga aurantiaca]MBK6263974.1 hypothetical protein [Marivirga aurantiaca]
MIKKLILIILLLSIVFVWLVPKESDYLSRIALDLINIHEYTSVAPADLQKMGSYRFDHMLFYSKFTYRYGNISIKYYGFLTFIFFSEAQTVEELPDEVIV